MKNAVVWEEAARSGSPCGGAAGRTRERGCHTQRGRGRSSTKPQELDKAAEVGDRQHRGGGRERRSVLGGVRVLLGGCLVGGDQGQQFGDV